MNIWIKRWSVENSLLAIFFCVTTLLFFLTLLNIQSQEMLDIYTNGLSEKNSITFFIEENENIKLKEMNEQIDESFLLLKRGVDSTKKIHAVFNKGLEFFFFF